MNGILATTPFGFPGVWKLSTYQAAVILAATNSAGPSTRLVEWGPSTELVEWGPSTELVGWCRLPALVPVKLSNRAAQMATTGEPVVPVRGVVPVAAVVRLFPAGTYRHYRATTTLYCVVFLLLTVWAPCIATRTRRVRWIVASV